MAFLTSGNDLRAAYANAESQASSLRRWWLGGQGTTAVRDQFTSQPQSADNVLVLLEKVRTALAVWNQSASTPGIADYARTFLNRPDYDVVAEFTAMVAEAESLLSWIVSAWNANASDYLTLAPDGSRIIKSFTVAQLSGLVTRMDALVARIA